LQAAPVAACLLLVAGIGAGSLGGYEFAQNRAAHAAAISAGTESAAVTAASATTVVQQQSAPSVPAAAEPLIANVASVSSIVRQPGYEMVEVSYNQLVPEHIRGSLDDPAIRQLLMLATENSASAGVREKALEGLEPYVAEDVRVRNAVLEALLNDNDPRIRTESINILGPVEADTSVRQVLYSVSTTDDNPHIRNVSRQVLSRVSEIQ
jgi:hypothetical protein